jgi:hypothetical protein
LPQGLPQPGRPLLSSTTKLPRSLIVRDRKRRDTVDEATAIVALNVEANPDAFNTYNSLGEAHMVSYLGVE